MWCRRRTTTSQSVQRRRRGGRLLKAELVHSRTCPKEIVPSVQAEKCILTKRCSHARSAIRASRQNRFFAGGRLCLSVCTTYVQGGFFDWSALEMTKYEEKLKYLNWSANCSSRKVPTLSKFSLNKLVGQSWSPNSVWR